MCLTERMTYKEVVAYRRKLPKIFVAYKVVRKDFGHLVPLFWSSDHQPNTTKPGIHVAGYYPGMKVPILYRPGFHVFKTKAVAEGYAAKHVEWVVQKIHIRRNWVRQVGTGCSDFKSKGKILVCSRIEVKE